MITKEKNRTKIISTVITAVLAADTGGSVLRLYNVQNVIKVRTGEEGFDALQGEDFF